MWRMWLTLTFLQHQKLMFTEWDGMYSPLLVAWWLDFAPWPSGEGGGRGGAAKGQWSLIFGCNRMWERALWVYTLQSGSRIVFRILISHLLKCCITKLSLRTEFTQFMDASVYLVYRSPSHVQNSIVGDTYIYRVLITTSNIMVSFTFPHCMHDTSFVPRRPSHVAWVWGMMHNDDISTVEPRLLDSPEKWTLRM